MRNKEKKPKQFQRKQKTILYKKIFIRNQIKLERKQRKTIQKELKEIKQFKKKIKNDNNIFNSIYIINTST